MVMGSSLLFEILAIIICLYWLDGKEFKLNGKVICMVIMHIGIFYLCDLIGYHELFTVIFYLIVAVYSGFEFLISVFQVFIRIVIMLVLCAGIQILSALPLLLLNGIIAQEWINLIVNLFTFLVIFFLYKKVNIQPFMIYMDGENKKAVFLCISVSGMVFVYIINAQSNAGMDGMNYLLFFIMAVIILLLTGVWEKYRIQVKEKEIEMRTNQTYLESYKDLVDEIRTRQHEFNNHLQAIVNQQYTCNTYEELVQAQSKYMEVLVKDNRYYKLIDQGNSVFLGFLYGKLLSLGRQGVYVRYVVKIGQLENSMPVHKMIEITSDLLTNACEAISFPVDVEEAVYLYIVEHEDKIDLEVRNIGPPISMDVIGQWFKKGYSRKGQGRGLGLYNVQKILSEYNGSISCMNESHDQHNWISFKVKIPKSVCIRSRLWNPY